MRIDTEAFLAITALIAATAVPACSSDKGGGGEDAGSGGSGATSSGGSGGKASGGMGTGASGGTGAAGGGSGGIHSVPDAGDGGPDTGTPVEAGTDSGPGYCIGDTIPTLPDAGPIDAGSEGGADPCNSLPGAVDGCQDDAGGEGAAPAYLVCADLQYRARPGIFDSVVKCLAGATNGYPACGATANRLAVACYDATIAVACPVSLPDGGPGNSCDTFVKSCKAVTAKQCNGALRAFSEEGASEFAACLGGISIIDGDGGVEGGGDCSSAFWSCALPGITR